MLKRYKKAIKIFKIAEDHALDKTYEKYPRGIKDIRVGVHLPPGHHNEAEEIRNYLGYVCPIRWRDPEIEELVVSIPSQKRQFVQLGNELENEGVQGNNVYTVSEWLMTVQRISEGKKEKIPSPSLMTLKQFPEWRRFLKANHFISEWCLNFHPPGFLRNRASGLGDSWECIKNIAHLIEFKEKTTQPIIVTEFGAGETHLLTSVDLKFIYIILDMVFGKRLLALLIYNSSTAKSHKALDVFRH